MLLEPFDLLPHEIPGLTQHLDSLHLARAAQLEHVLYFPDVRQGAAHFLYGAWLLLFALLLLLSALCHGFTFLSAFPNYAKAFTRCKTKLDYSLQGQRLGRCPVESQGSNPQNTEEDPELSPQARSGGDIEQPSNEEPDVILDIPTLEVEEIDLEVDDLRAHISVRAELAGLVNIDIGVDAYLNHLKLNVKGVEAQAQLKVRLDKILGTIDRALSAIEANPDLLNRKPQGEETADAPDSRSTEEAGEPSEQTQPPMPGIPSPSEPQPELEEGGGAPDDDSGEVMATEAARRKARELGVDLNFVEPTGSGGRIILGDVKRAANG